MKSASYGGAVADKPKRLLHYTKWDRDTILKKYRKLQALHREERARTKTLSALLAETLPNLDGYVIMAADQPGSLWSRIFTAIEPEGLVR